MLKISDSIPGIVNCLQNKRKTEDKLISESSETPSNLCKPDQKGKKKRKKERAMHNLWEIRYSNMQLQLKMEILKNSSLIISKLKTHVCERKK